MAGFEVPGDSIEERSLSAPAEHEIHKALARLHLFHSLRTGDPESESYIRRLIADCDSEPSFSALREQLQSCRAGGWLTAGDAVSVNHTSDLLRERTWRFFSDLLEVSQERLKIHREDWAAQSKNRHPDTESANQLKDKLNRATSLVDAIAMQIYFASGASADGSEIGKKSRLTPPQLKRFWEEAAPLLNALSLEIHPRTAHRVLSTLIPLLACSPREVFSMAATSILSSTEAGFEHEYHTVDDVVKLLQQVLADHREIVFEDPACQSKFLKVLDVFVEAGRSEARQLTHRLEEIYR